MDQRKFIVLSTQHQLLPIAHKLKHSESQDTDVVVWKKSFERAWDGLIKKRLSAKHSQIHSGSVEKLKEQATAGAVVVSDLETVKFEGSSVFQCEGNTLAKSPIQIGFWFDGEAASLVHLLVYDIGAWPGGLGLAIPAGVTLIEPQRVDEAVMREVGRLLVPTVERASELKFKGLVNVELIEDAGGLALANATFGWPWLGTQAFLSAYSGSFSGLLLGEPPKGFLSRYTVAFPVSTSPWPTDSRAHMRGVSVEGREITLDAKLHPNVFFHDVQADVENKRILTAGTDGLVGVVHANANVFAGAQMKAQLVAGRVGLEGLQYRVDVGNNVQLVLAQLEDQYGIVL